MALCLATRSRVQVEGVARPISSCGSASAGSYQLRLLVSVVEEPRETREDNHQGETRRSTNGDTLEIECEERGRMEEEGGGGRVDCCYADSGRRRE